MTNKITAETVREEVARLRAASILAAYVGHRLGIGPLYIDPALVPLVAD